MVIYAEGDFLDANHMLMMILNFIQFGVAISTGACGKDDGHGFEDGGFSVDLESIFSFDIEEMSNKLESNHSFMTYFLSMFTMFGQDDDSSAGMAGIIASIGLLGA